MSNVRQGSGCKLPPDLTIVGDVKVELGDQVFIGAGVRIIGDGTVRFGDYSKVHSGCFITVPHPWSVVEFGCNTWIGERSVLDGRGCLKAGHNVGVGIASHLYSHIAHGDTMAGCRFMSEQPLTIGDDAWFVGQCLVSPVKVGERSMAMLGSTVTRDMLPNTIYAGVPAKDMTEKMGRPWTDPPAEERLKLFEQRVQEYCELFRLDHKRLEIEGVASFPSTMSERVTYFNVMTRTYTKRSTPGEVSFMNWLTSWKGRFIPEQYL